MKHNKRLPPDDSPPLVSPDWELGREIDEIAAQYFYQDCDRSFIRAFQVMDRIIQNNQPIFVLVWIGSIISLVTSAVFGIVKWDGTERLLIIFAVIVYLLLVQLPTFTINIPLNNKLQTLDVDGMDETAQKAARRDFEPRWIRWNSIRTTFATLVSSLLIILLLRL